jgi:acyl-CoA thioesterase YciA
MTTCLFAPISCTIDVVLRQSGGRFEHQMACSSLTVSTHAAVGQDMKDEHPIGTPVIRTIAMPADTNPSGDIFGGWLMAQMDLAAGNAAARRARGRCATIAVDSMVFHRPVYVGDEVSLYAKIVRVGRTSMGILVEAWRRSRDEDLQFKVTEATFTFVAIDSERKPRPIPDQTE